MTKIKQQQNQSTEFESPLKPEVEKQPWVLPQILSVELLEAAAVACEEMGQMGKTFPTDCSQPGS